jgi:uncharacterized protein YcaQ
VLFSGWLFLRACHEVAVTAAPLSLSLETARRLAVHRQRLSGPRLPPTKTGLLEMARDLRCLQLDPISAVARSHTLVAFSRVGPFDTALLDQLLFDDKHWFEYWAHAASIVLTEDYPIHHAHMRGYVRGHTPWEQRVRDWLDANADLRDLILRDLRAHGPRLSRQFDVEGLHPEGWVSTGWTSGRNVSRMLDFLWTRGDIMVAGRSGGQKLWDLTERVLPEWADRAEIDAETVTCRAIQHAVRALGVAKTQHIKRHFIRGRYSHFESILKRLESEGKLVRAHVHGHGSGLRGDWWIHADDVALADQVGNGAWQPRAVLLSPFDNLICDRARTQALWNFDFTIEIYVPAAKRRYGYYVLPILDGDRLIGRIDPAYKRTERRLAVQHVYAEPNAPDDPATAQRIAAAVRELGEFLGAQTIEVAGADGVPAAWQQALRAL